MRESIKGLKDRKRAAAVKVATKVNPAGASGEAHVTGGFKKGLLKDQAEDSYTALGVDSIELFYLHWPDKGASMEEALEQVECLHREGRFKKFGLSNFSAEEVSRISEYMARRGWVLPSVFQGLYNPVTRGVESALFPVLREHGMSFYAYNPLAGGLLTGKHKFDMESLGDTDGR